MSNLFFLNESNKSAISFRLVFDSNVLCSDELILGDVLKQIQPYSSTSPSGKKKASTVRVVHMESQPSNGTSIQSPPEVVTSVPAVSDERKEKIDSVKMILDFLGEGFINECLELYNDNVEVVCDRILSENLAEPLLELDRNMPLATKTTYQPQPPLSSNSPAIPTTNSTASDFIALPGEYDSFHIGKMKKFYKPDNDDEEFREINKRFYKNVYEDEYDDSMDQYSRFEVDDGETEDERVSLTESGEFAMHEDAEEFRVAEATPPSASSRKNKRKFAQRQRNQVKVTDPK